MKRIAAMDISKNRIGIAFSDVNCTFASCSFFIEGNNKKNNIKKLYDEYDPEITYIGLPVNFDGSESNQTYFVKNFVHQIRHIIGKFEYEDERFSTQKAKTMYPKTKKTIDEVVAINILNKHLINEIIAD